MPLPPQTVTIWLPPVIQAVVFITLLTAASVSDIRKRIIPDSICALIASAGLICFSPVRLFGTAAALPLLFPALYKQGSVGGGDIKLTAACGFVLGFGCGMAGLIIGLAAMLLFFAGSRAAARLRKKRRRKENGTQALPMAPFLSAGFVIAYIFLNFTGF
jgi:leader peptidase (prepilin peptidase)/N-methyltransferase